MDHGGLVEVCKFSHIIRFVKLGGIDLVDIVYVNLPLLETLVSIV